MCLIFLLFSINIISKNFLKIKFFVLLIQFFLVLLIDIIGLVETVGVEPTKKACKASSFPLAYIPIKQRFVLKRIKRLQLLTPLV